MKQRGVNVKNVLPFVLLLVVNLVLGFGFAKANLLAQGGLERDVKLTLWSASLPDGLNGVKEESLARVGLHENALVKDLVPKAALDGSLDVVANHLTGWRL